MWARVAIGMLALAVAVPAAGQGLERSATTTAVRFDPADPRYRELYALGRTAAAIDLNDAGPAQLPALRAAWTALYERASATKVAGGVTGHPLAGRALLQLALIEQRAGKYPLASKHADQGVALLAPFRQHYQLYHAYGRTLQGFFKFAAGDASGALAILEPSVALVQAYVDSLPPGERTKEVWTLRADSEYSFAQALGRTGQVDRAAIAQRRSMESLAAGLGPNDGNVLLSQMDVAVFLGRAGRREEAEPIARDAVERTIAHVDRDKPAYGKVLAFAGLMMARNGRRREGLDYIAAGLAAITENKSDSLLGLTQLKQGYAVNLIELERYGDALPILTAAATTFKSLDAAFDVRKARSLVGLAQFAQGDSAAAVVELMAAVGGAPDPRTREVAQVSLPPLTVATLDVGQIAAARGHADAFATLVKASEGPRAFLKADADALSAYVALHEPGAGDRARARTAAVRLIAVVADNRTLALDGELPIRDRAALDLALRIATKIDDPAVALNAMVALAGSRIALANHLIVDRLITADPALATQVRALQNGVRALQAADNAYEGSLATNADVPARRAARDAASAQVASLRVAMTRDYPDWVEARGVVSTDVAMLQQGLRPDEALLAVIPALDNVYLLAVSRDRVLVERATITRAALTALTNRLRGSLPVRFDGDAAHLLYRHIFSPGIRGVVGRARSVRIVATGPFAALPFATLLERPTTRLNATAPWLIKRYALRTTAGFSADLPARVRSGAPSRVLAIGAPTPFVASTFDELQVAQPAAGVWRGGSATQRLSALPALPATGVEVQRIARLLGAADATILLGDKASEENVTSLDLMPFSVLVFATHGLIGGEMEGMAEPALVLSPPSRGSPTDGLLAASEIGRLRIDADWVILSACNTAAGDGVGGSTYGGLATAFRFAGARSLLVSHWPVRDDAAAAITLATVAGARNGLQRSVALRRAMLLLMNDRSVDKGDNPFVWAPFVLLD